MTTLSIILVVYNKYSDLEKLVKLRPIVSTKIVIVDNSNPEYVDNNAIERIRAACPDLIYIRSPRNLGYAGAANYAVECIPSLLEDDFVALSNTDLSYNADEILDLLSRNHRNDDSVGLIAPRLVSVSGEHIRQLHYINAPSSRKYNKLGKIYSSYYLAVAHRVSADIKRMIFSYCTPGAVPAVIFAPHGALIIATRRYMNMTRGFNHVATLFCEEAFVGVECRRAGLKCVYAPEITYYHENHGSMGVIPNRVITKFLSEAHLSVAKILD